MKTTEIQQELSSMLPPISTLRDKVANRLRREEGFNVMSLLRKSTDERRLHSRFIAAVLDPKAPHGMEDTFLKLFLKRIQSSFSYDFSHLRITPRYDFYSEDENIDILIEDTETGQTIIIENKIYAPDQQGQLMRYFANRASMLNLKNNIDEAFKKIEVFYLTLDGHRPDGISYVLSNKQELEMIPSQISNTQYQELRNGKLDSHIRSITYGHHINSWIEDCLAVCKDDSLRIQLKNYHAIIMKLANTQENINERRKLVQILGKGNNWEAADYLLRNLNHIRWHIVNDFFIALFKELAVDSALHQDELNRITDFAHKSRNKKILEFKRTINSDDFIIKYNDKGMIVLETKNGWYENLTTSGYFEDENLLHLSSLQFRSAEIKRITEKIREII